MADALPDYDSLPVVDDAPPGSSWGLWGPGDRLGCLNLLTDERVRAGLAEARRGVVFNLNLEVELPSPPLFGRKAPRHVVHDRGAGLDDELSDWNTQSSSQWDGFRHVRHPFHGFYNGVPNELHGVHHWARAGIVGRAVLADVGRQREAAGRPLRCGESDVVTPDDLLGTLDAQGTPVEVGDILLVRTGWTAWYRGQDPPARAALAADPRLAACGLERSEAMSRTLWDLHVAAIACDNPAVEVWPRTFGLEPGEYAARLADPLRAADTFLHFSLIPLLGIPLGELFDLDALARDCAADGRYACLLTSAPLNLEAGVASPPNALALR